MALVYLGHCVAYLLVNQDQMRPTTDTDMHHAYSSSRYDVKEWIVYELSCFSTHLYIVYPDFNSHCFEPQGARSSLNLN